MDRDSYISPFTERYGDDAMRHLFSDQCRHRLWRKLWYTLANSECILGAPITAEQVAEIYAVIATEDIDYKKVAQYESETHHDVMAHLMAFSDQCPKAKGILHLGATSCYITDNSDIIIMRDALSVLRTNLKCIIEDLCTIALDNVSMPLVGRTHLQKAQLTTVGKRICMWIQDLFMDYEQISHTIHHMKLLGCKGATGSQSSLHTLFDGNYDKAYALDRLIGIEFGMECIDISGQTYTRKIDSNIANVLSQIAQSASKMATDIRLMSSFGEMYEGFDKKQVGSSAMPYKRNPITCEKICGISRFVICNSMNTAITASTQWLERTLDDSSNKRIVMAELFLGVSEILSSLHHVVKNMKIDGTTCLMHAEEHSKMASLEDDIIRSVMSGGDRLEGHMSAIQSDGSDNAKINTGFAAQQAENFCRTILCELGLRSEMPLNAMTATPNNN